MYFCHQLDRSHPTQVILSMVIYFYWNRVVNYLVVYLGERYREVDSRFFHYYCRSRKNNTSGRKSFK